jgi:poly(3-hydroxybutyrate) depolymerase
MNLFTIFLAIAVAFVAHAGAGCVSPEAEFEATPGGPSVRFELQFQHDSQGVLKRHIWIHIPKNYKHDEPAPVILAFHGKGQDVLDFEKATNLSNPLVNQDLVVVYPEGLNVSLRTVPQQPLKSLNWFARSNL